MARERFWETKKLQQMNASEWEALCDGCGKCCLVKLQDEDTDELFYTNVACRYLDETCRCSVYSQRRLKQPDCIELTVGDIEAFAWLPPSCAYRRLAEGAPLPYWHPLLTGDSNSVGRAGHSVAGKVCSEAQVHPDDLEDFIVRWVDAPVSEKQ